ncbi:hypothetical protein BH10PSE12_BH10PSE12_09610 [soil metagenome]
MSLIRSAASRLRGRAVAALALACLLSACAGTVHHAAAPQRYSQPKSLDLRQCYAKLTATEVRFNPLPDRNYGGGCSAIGSVKLLDIGVPATNLGAMTCQLAANFAAWARYGVQPAARLILGSEIARIETYGTYNCRPIAGSAKLSEHAHSNAIDISAFVLADGRRIDIRSGWRSDPRTQQFLRVVRTSACRRFRTVLSPDYNSAHQDHLHFDMGGKGGFCR